MTHAWINQLDRVYRKHRRSLWVCALAVTGCPHRAEDAMHDAFAKLMRVSRPPERVRAYVFRAVRNAALDAVRRDERIDPRERAQQLFAVEADRPDVTCADGDERRRLAAAVAELPLEQREVIMLRLNAQLKWRQIAAVMDRPVSTVSTWYRDALETLRVQLESS